jgi:hypothetical protein
MENLCKYDAHTRIKNLVHKFIAAAVACIQKQHASAYVSVLPAAAAAQRTRMRRQRQQRRWQ